MAGALPRLVVGVGEQQRAVAKAAVAAEGARTLEPWAFAIRVLPLSNLTGDRSSGRAEQVAAMGGGDL